MSLALVDLCILVLHHQTVSILTFAFNNNYNRLITIVSLFSGGSGFVRVMFVFFLGVVPFISLSLFILYYCQQNRPWFISQPSANEYVPTPNNNIVMRKELIITDKKLIFSTNSKVWPNETLNIESRT